MEQVLGELKKTVFSSITNVLLLSARDGAKTGCVHKHVKEKKGADQILACTTLRQHKSCSYSEGLYAYLADPSHRACKVQDIEDMVVEATTKNHFCPYFFNRDEENLAKADLICMPYAYLVSQETRKNIKLDWEKCIIIIDEAHNIEDACETAYSFSLNSTQIASATLELNGLLLNDMYVNKIDAAQLKMILLRLEQAFVMFCNENVGKSFQGGEIYSVLNNANISFENAGSIIKSLSDRISEIQLGFEKEEDTIHRSRTSNAKHLEMIQKAFRTLFYMNNSSVFASLVEEDEMKKKKQENVVLQNMASIQK